MNSRKTYDVYSVYQNFGYGFEEVDSFSTYKEAKDMAREYTLAHKVPALVRKHRVKK